MKRLIWILIVGLILVVNIYCKLNNLSVPEVINTEKTSQTKTDKDNIIQTREYAQKALKSIGRLNVLEGKYHYSNEIIDKGFMDLTIRQMTLDLEYKCGIGIDLQYINVKSVFDRVVILQILKDKLELQYIELDTENSRITNDKKMLLVSDFKPSEVEVLLEESQYNVAGKINSDAKLFDKAMINLKNELDGLMKKLDYEEVIFEVI